VTVLLGPTRGKKKKMPNRKTPVLPEASGLKRGKKNRGEVMGKAKEGW